MVGKLVMKQEKVYTDKIQESRIYQLRLYLPNLLSIFRIISSPFLFFFIFIEDYILALILFTTDIVSDILDGHLARKFKINSRSGVFFDVIGDFLFIFSTINAFIITEIYPFWILFIIILMFSQFLLTSKIKEPIYDPIGKYYGTFLMGILWITLIDFIGYLITSIIISFIVFTIISIISRILALYSIKIKKIEKI